MPSEKFPGPEIGGGVAKRDEMESWLSSPAGQAWQERSNAEIGDAATHAENWLNATSHLHDEGVVAEGHKLINKVRRGLMVMDEVNDQMTHLFGSSYPHFDPSDAPNNIPPHLGDQFR